MTSSEDMPEFTRPITIPDVTYVAVTTGIDDPVCTWCAGTITAMG